MSVWWRTALVLLAAAVLVALQVDAKAFHKIGKSKTLGKEVENWGVIPHGLLIDNLSHLEDFYALEDEEMPINLKYVRNIRMGLGLKQDDEVELDRYYEEATANLRSEAPSLHFITFYDGYSYFAESPGNNTVERLHEEIRFLSEHIDRIARVTSLHQLTIEHGSTLFVQYVFNESVIAAANIEATIRETFDVNATRLRASKCAASIEFSAQNFRVHMELTFADRLSQFIVDDYPRGRALRADVADATTRGRVSARIANTMLSKFMPNTFVARVFACTL